MITLKDIARECNVSFSTVSKALKGSPEISAEKIELVQKKAKEMGYHPNIAARTLRTNRTYDLGIIFEDKTGAGFQHQYFAKIISGFQNIAQNKGYVMTFMTYTGKNKNDYYNHAKARNFDGVAVLSADYMKEGIRTLVESEIPTITLDYSYGKNHISIMSDNKSGMAELTEYVIQNGHKKIALIHGEDTLVTKERKDIFLQVCNEHGISVPSTYFAQALYHDPITSQEATNILLNLKDPPTCILYPDDYSALGGIRELNSRHLKPGKDVSIAGYDGIMLTSLMIPPLTTYEQDGEKIGRSMAELLIKTIEENSSSEQIDTEPVKISGRLLKGGTVINIQHQ